ncbi:hypothetical protein JF66_00925 [Cryobacterium sp. MLB-32]|uniref:sensor domain-containing protein n=1 Tax=Cryobacterium sp. MLB-32 TaxID=1529318 RepID=UPI0004E6F893|nr:diguanylate cyclase [Cryobacterium sp. MLB-32]KFF60948.1 hypothetical protein JF66_00925 [Cryobacterium sp. MLB-32]
MTGVFEDLYENAPCGYIVTTPHGVVTRSNGTFAAWMGLSPEELIGRSFERLLTPASHIFYQTRFVPVLRLAGTVHEVSLTLRCAAGKSLPVLVNATTKFATDGEPLFVRTAVFDATERHYLEHQLVSARRVAESSEARVRVLQNASTAFAACTTATDLAEAVVTSARQAFRATNAAVLLGDSAETLAVAAGTHPIDPALPESIPTPWADALTSGAIVTISSLAEAARCYPGFEQVLRAHRIEALSVVPLRAGTRVLGVLICSYGRQRTFDAPSTELHAALARQSTEALERIRLQDELRRLALYDQLTGLANRKLLNQTLDTMLDSAQRLGSPVGLIFFDLDGFKAVNDHLGHLVGDGVLREIAGRLRTIVREQDVVARFGGDEFVIVCESARSVDALALAERIRLAVRLPLTGSAAAHRLTASVGLAVYEPTDQAHPSATDMLRLADSAMYQSKQAGKDRVTTLRA